jgi:hypothetical protein
LAITLPSGDSLEDAVQDYINRNLDYFELASIVSVKEFILFFSLKTKKLINIGSN